MTFPATRRAALALVLVLGLAACARTSGVHLAIHDVVVHPAAAGAAPSLPPGTTLALVADGEFADGSRCRLAAPDLAWSSSDETILKVAADGTASALKPGAAQAVATYADDSGKLALTGRPRARAADRDRRRRHRAALHGDDGDLLRARTGPIWPASLPAFVTRTPTMTRLSTSVASCTLNAGR